jgi:lipopolysaccharide/colanic/teichoic acid biosynthesis glycosyltransferase
MVTDAESTGHQITVGDDPRITKSGSCLRRYKLDEFPQLINVFLGDMSIVGPRPEVPRYVEMFHDQYKDVLTVKPGITDFAAIEFRNEEDVLKKYEYPEEGYVKEVLPKKIELYKKYLKEKCFRTDIKLIILTLKKLL